ncbi:hypothetical protein M8818_002192 [Zalaria obscura]|uniref:Uncharacterized protein n=1 Tax=Zalaria obscura TaxID=2024903 RepID=A0ACC3SIJ4_9PEZI
MYQRDRSERQMEDFQYLMCGTCKELIATDEPPHTRVFACGHRFHTACIRDEDSTCPNPQCQWEIRDRVHNRQNSLTHDERQEERRVVKKERQITLGAESMSRQPANAGKWPTPESSEGSGSDQGDVQMDD